MSKILATRQMEYLRINPNLIILETSPGVKRFADQPTKAIAGKDVRLSFPELIGLEKVIKEVLAGKKPGFYLNGIARISESTFPLYIDLYLSEFKEEETLESQILVMLEDVTEKMVLKQALVQRSNEANLLLSALASSKDYLDKIIASMAEPLLVTTRSGQIKMVNPAAQALFGYSQEELINQPLTKIINDENFLEKIPINNPYSSSGNGLKELDVICQTKSGKELLVSFSFSRVQTDVVGVENFIYIGRDITERKRAEDEILTALEQQKELNEMRSSFVSMISHEFRTPMTIILTSTELLQSYCDQPEKNSQKIGQYFQMIESAIQQMTKLLDEVLLINQAESGKLEFHPAPLDLRNFCQEVVEHIQVSAGEKHRLTFTSATSDPVPAYMDESLLRRILNNLLGNAIKFSPLGGNVTLKLSCQNQEAVFQVIDEGIGIDSEDKKHLFKSFQRGKNARNISGTGLGLAIVKRALELHRGSISFTSEVGKGTTFRVVVPLQPHQQRKQS